MSWSFSGIGKPEAVYNKAKEQLDLAMTLMPEPEQSVAFQVLNIIRVISKTMPKKSVIKVNASGSQYKTGDHSTPEGGTYNTLKIDIEPVYGFVE